MRIGLVGGIFDKPDSYRAQVLVTPETVLAEGLGRRGHAVTTWGHRQPVPDQPFDVVHVHHLGRGALRAVAASAPFARVFTAHAEPAVSASVSRRLALWLTVRRADAVVALSDTEAAAQRSLHRVPASRQRVIGNGVDAERFAFATRRPPDDGQPWRLLFVGQLIALKRVDVLLHAMALLRQQRSVTVDLVFHVDDQLESLRRLAHGLGLGDAVHFLGPLSPDELADVYRASHAVVLPSSTESLPTVLTEAMLTGTPVVATDVGGVAEQMDGAGCLVPPGDAGALAEAIGGLTRDYHRHLRAAPEIRAKAVDRFSVSAMVGAHEALYQELVARQSSRARQRSAGSRTGRSGGGMRQSVPLADG